jgi:hypothetical protein
MGATHDDESVSRSEWLVSEKHHKKLLRFWLIFSKNEVLIINDLQQMIMGFLHTERNRA